MLWFKKNAEFIGYAIIHGEKILEWKCPNKKCRAVIAGGSARCPKCGQRLRFELPMEGELFMAMEDAHNSI